MSSKQMSLIIGFELLAAFLNAFIINPQHNAFTSYTRCLQGFLFHYATQQQKINSLQIRKIGLKSLLYKWINIVTSSCNSYKSK